MSANEYDAKILGGLIDSTIDSAEAYAEAACEPAGAAYAEVFRRRAAERRQAVLSLQRWVRVLGREPERSQAMEPSQRRGFPSPVNGASSDRAAVAAEIERGEDYLQDCFKDAMRDQNVSPSTRLLIADVYAAIRAGREQMYGLRYVLRGRA